MISKKHKCIFIHIPKTAGQSVERVFLDLNGLDWKNRSSLLLYKNTTRSDAPPRLSHLTAEEYVSLGFISNEEFSSYYKFSVVRNPWDRIKSMYKYLNYNQFYTFEQFVENLPRLEKSNPMFFKSQWEYLAVDNRLAVDRVCKFETLQQDFNLVTQDLGLPPINLPHTNNNTQVTTSKVLKMAFSDPLLIAPFLQNNIASQYINSELKLKPQTIKAIEKFYLKDTEVFQYTYTDQLP